MSGSIFAHTSHLNTEMQKGENTNHINKIIMLPLESSRYKALCEICALMRNTDLDGLLSNRTLN